MVLMTNTLTAKMRVLTKMLMAVVVMCFSCASGLTPNHTGTRSNKQRQFNALGCEEEGEDDEEKAEGR